MWGRKQINADVVAEIVDGSLVVAMTVADTPKVWRTSAEKFSTASFEVQDNNGKHALVMVNDKTSENIADFSDKDNAIYALRVVMSAMTGGSTVVKADKKSDEKPALVARRLVQSASSGSGIGRFFKKVLKFLLWVVIVGAVLFVVLPLLFPSTGQNPNIENKMQQIEKGAPVPADELFGN